MNRYTAFHSFHLGSVPEDLPADLPTYKALVFSIPTSARIPGYAGLDRFAKNREGALAARQMRFLAALASEITKIARMPGNQVAIGARSHLLLVELLHPNDDLSVQRRRSRRPDECVGIRVWLMVKEVDVVASPDPSDDAKSRSGGARSYNNRNAGDEDGGGGGMIVKLAKLLDVAVARLVLPNERAKDQARNAESLKISRAYAKGGSFDSLAAASAALACDLADQKSISAGGALKAVNSGVSEFEDVAGSGPAHVYASITADELCSLFMLMTSKPCLKEDMMRQLKSKPPTIAYRPWEIGSDAIVDIFDVFSFERSLSVFTGIEHPKVWKPQCIDTNYSEVYVVVGEQRVPMWKLPEAHVRETMYGIWDFTVENVYRNEGVTRITPMLPFYIPLLLPTATSHVQQALTTIKGKKPEEVVELAFAYLRSRGGVANSSQDNDVTMARVAIKHVYGNHDQCAHPEAENASISKELHRMVHGLFFNAVMQTLVIQMAAGSPVVVQLESLTTIRDVRTANDNITADMYKQIQAVSAKRLKALAVTQLSAEEKAQKIDEYARDMKREYAAEIRRHLSNLGVDERQLKEAEYERQRETVELKQRQQVAEYKKELDEQPQKIAEYEKEIEKIRAAAQEKKLQNFSLVWTRRLVMTEGLSNMQRALLDHIDANGGSLFRRGYDTLEGSTRSSALVLDMANNVYKGGCFYGGYQMVFPLEWCACMTVHKGPDDAPLAFNIIQAGPQGIGKSRAQDVICETVQPCSITRLTDVSAKAYNTTATNSDQICIIDEHPHILLEDPAKNNPAANAQIQREKSRLTLARNDAVIVEMDPRRTTRISSSVHQMEFTSTNRSYQYIRSKTDPGLVDRYMLISIRPDERYADGVTQSMLNSASQPPEAKAFSKAWFELMKVNHLYVYGALLLSRSGLIAKPDVKIVALVTQVVADHMRNSGMKPMTPRDTVRLELLAEVLCVLSTMRYWFASIESPLLSDEALTQWALSSNGSFTPPKLDIKDFLRIHFVVSMEQAITALTLMGPHLENPMQRSAIDRIGQFFSGLSTDTRCYSSQRDEIEATYRRLCIAAKARKRRKLDVATAPGTYDSSGGYQPGKVIEADHEEKQRISKDGENLTIEICEKAKTLGQLVNRACGGRKSTVEYDTALYHLTTDVQVADMYETYDDKQAHVDRVAPALAFFRRTNQSPAHYWKEDPKKLICGLLRDICRERGLVDGYDDAFFWDLTTYLMLTKGPGGPLMQQSKFNQFVYMFNRRLFDAGSDLTNIASIALRILPDFMVVNSTTLTGAPDPVWCLSSPIEVLPFCSHTARMGHTPHVPFYRASASHVTDEDRDAVARENGTFAAQQLDAAKKEEEEKRLRLMPSPVDESVVMDLPVDTVIRLSVACTQCIPYAELERDCPDPGLELVRRAKFYEKHRNLARFKPVFTYQRRIATHALKVPVYNQSSDLKAVLSDANACKVIALRAAGKSAEADEAVRLLRSKAKNTQINIFKMKLEEKERVIKNRAVQYVQNLIKSGVSDVYDMLLRHYGKKDRLDFEYVLTRATPILDPIGDSCHKCGTNTDFETRLLEHTAKEDLDKAEKWEKTNHCDNKHSSTQAKSSHESKAHPPRQRLSAAASSSSSSSASASAHAAIVDLDPDMDLSLDADPPLSAAAAAAAAEKANELKEASFRFDELVQRYKKSSAVAMLTNHILGLTDAQRGRLRKYHEKFTVYVARLLDKDGPPHPRLDDVYSL